MRPPALPLDRQVPRANVLKRHVARVGVHLPHHLEVGAHRFGHAKHPVGRRVRRGVHVVAHGPREPDVVRFCGGCEGVWVVVFVAGAVGDGGGAVVDGTVAGLGRVVVGWVAPGLRDCGQRVGESCAEGEAVGDFSGRPGFDVEADAAETLVIGFFGWTS